MTVSEYFEAFNQLNVLIVGDVMIDSYLWGKVSRISPEAPVPVVNAERRENRLGGAANVARNIKALGANPILCAVVGADEDGRILSKLLEDDGMSTDGIVQSTERITTVKHRILAGSQQMLRLDQEMSHQISATESERLLTQLKQIIEAKKIDIIIFEDYDKGVLHTQLIQEVITFAKSKNIPTTVDPKKRNFLSYTGASLFKPNLKELMEGLNFSQTDDVLADVKKATKALKEKMNIEAAMITLSEHGVYITDFEKEYHIPAHLREIADVSGAGDTVISIASACLALGMPIEQVAEIANLGGGLVCEYLGVVPIIKEKLEEEAHKILA